MAEDRRCAAVQRIHVCQRRKLHVPGLAKAGTATRQLASLRSSRARFRRSLRELLHAAFPASRQMDSICSHIPTIPSDENLFQSVWSLEPDAAGSVIWIDRTLRLAGGKRRDVFGGLAVSLPAKRMDGGS